MKTVKLILLAALLGAVAGGSAWAAPMGHGGGFAQGHGGFAHGHDGFVPRHDGFDHRGFHHFHHGARVGVFFGGPLFWPPYYYPYYYPSYAPSVVVVPSPVYIEQGSDASYWYFCSDPKGYYPYVKECPPGWVQVTPQPPAGY